MTYKKLTDQTSTIFSSLLTDKLLCKFCKRECKSIHSLRSHQSMCHSNPEYTTNLKKRRIVPKVCPYCKTTFLQNRHPYYCVANPNCKEYTPKNQYIKAKEMGIPYTISDELREKFKNRKPTIHTEATKAKLSKIMAEKAKSNPTSYSGRYNRGNVKEKVCTNGFKVLGSWEERFVEHCITNGIDVVQPSESFNYTFEGKSRIYYPDFYLPHKDLWVEVKGYQTPKDAAKWKFFVEVHKKKLLVVDKNNINKLDMLDI